MLRAEGTLGCGVWGLRVKLFRCYGLPWGVWHAGALPLGLTILE